MIDRLLVLEQNTTVAEMCGANSCSHHSRQEAEL